ncbi:MAG: hypothetical protein RLZZ299_1160 [Pseudomonadota bacterium]
MRSLPASMLVVALLTACGPKKAPAPPVPAAAPVPAAPVAPVEVAPPAAVDAPPVDPVAPVRAAPPTVEPFASAEELRDASDAVAMLTTTDPDRARSALERMLPLLDRYPRNASLLYHAGLAHANLRQFDEARARWTACVEVERTYGACWRSLGVLAMRTQGATAGLEALRKGVAAVPTDVGLRMTLVGALRAARQYAEAESVAKDAFRQSNAEQAKMAAYTALARVYLEQRRMGAARYALVEATTQDTAARAGTCPASNGELLLAHALLRQAINEEDVALTVFDCVLAVEPRSLAALTSAADIYLRKHRYESAVTMLERARDVAPGDPALHNNLGIAYRGVRRFDDARAAYAKALELAPKNPDPHRNLAALYGFHTGRFEDARKALDAYVAGGGTAPDVKAWRTEFDTLEASAKLAAEAAAAEAAAKAADAARAAAAPPPEAAPAAPPPDGGSLELPPAQTPWGPDAPTESTVPAVTPAEPSVPAVTPTEPSPPAPSPAPAGPGGVAGGETPRPMESVPTPAPSETSPVPPATPTPAPPPATEPTGPAQLVPESNPESDPWGAGGTP